MMVSAIREPTGSVVIGAMTRYTEAKIKATGTGTQTCGHCHEWRDKK